MTKKQREPSLASLMAGKLDGLSESEVMQLIGTIIDKGGDEQLLAALDHASTLLGQFLAGKVSARYVSRTHYFRANIWSTKRSASPNWQAWLWKSESIDGEILVTHVIDSQWKFRIDGSAM